MISAATAWELAGNTGGRFRLGLGTQVRAHVERRYGAEFDPPGPRLRDYVRAVRACFAAFAGREKLGYEGEFYRLTLLPHGWSPPRHEHPDIKVDGVHVHPLHSVHYLRERLLPAVAEGAASAGRSSADVDLIVPVFVVPGDTEEERAPLVHRAREQIAFYGSTKNYAFQFDDLGFEGTSAGLNELLKAGDLDGMRATITDEMLEHFAVIGPWDTIADTLRERYAGLAARIVGYLVEESVDSGGVPMGRWGEIARALR
jgi:probable F420-dependent oxidoreductase